MSDWPRLGGDVVDPPGYDYEADMARQLREAGLPPDGRRPRPPRPPDVETDDAGRRNKSAEQFPRLIPPPQVGGG